MQTDKPGYEPLDGDHSDDDGHTQASREKRLEQERRLSDAVLSEMGLNDGHMSCPPNLSSRILASMLATGVAATVGYFASTAAGDGDNSVVWAVGSGVVAAIASTVVSCFCCNSESQQLRIN